MIEQYPEYIEHVITLNVPRNQGPERVDNYIAKYVQNASRTKVQKAIDGGFVTINGKVTKVSRKVRPGDEIICKIYKLPPLELIPEDIPLIVVYEDDDVLIVNKPAGMCTHPGVGNRSGTLVNAVLYHFGKREAIPVEIDDEEDEDQTEEDIFGSDEVRPGIVHRIDKDTSGLMIVAKNPAAHLKLADQFAAHTIEREYNAIAWGEFKDDEGTYTGDIGRNPRNRKIFTVVKKGGKYALTNYTVLERFKYATLLKYKLHTGRTHQIRVHSAANNHPLIGDPEYGGDTIVYSGNIPSFRKVASKCIEIAKRQMLHAKTIGFIHPSTGKKMNFDSELPSDMQQVITELRKYTNL